MPMRMLHGAVINVVHRISSYSNGIRTPQSWYRVISQASMPGRAIVVPSRFREEPDLPAPKPRAKKPKAAKKAKSPKKATAVTKPKAGVKKAILKKKPTPKKPAATKKKAAAKASPKKKAAPKKK
jgi:hypothetical protein